MNRFVPSPSLSATHADSMLELPSELGSEPSELWHRLSLVVIGVVSATLKGAGLCGPAQKARQCVDGFVRTGLQQRWAPLLNFSSPWASHACPPLGGGRSMPIAPYVETLLEARPRAALPVLCAPPPRAPAGHRDPLS